MEIEKKTEINIKLDYEELRAIYEVFKEALERRELISIEKRIFEDIQDCI